MNKEDIIAIIDKFLELEGVPNFGTIKIVFKNSSIIYIGKEQTFEIRAIESTETATGTISIPDPKS